MPYGALSAYVTMAHLVGLPRLRGPVAPVLSLFAFALVHSGLTLGRLRALLMLGLTFVVSLAFESLGVATGWVYGPYHYTDLLGPRFLRLVPILIPTAWFMMIYPSQVIAEGLLRNRIRTGWL